MPSLNLYLTTDEFEWVRDAAERLGVSQSYIMRLLLRDLMGLPIGGSGRSEMTWLRELRPAHVHNLTGMR